MQPAAAAAVPLLFDSLYVVKVAVTVALLAFFWGWESLRPFFERREGRLRHAGRNLAIAIFNTILLALLFGSVTVLVAEWSQRRGWGLLNLTEFGWPLRLLLAVLVLDAWMYFWHRANHVIPLLWRFHRMHHSDNRMDVTTATRFHLGEHAGGLALRLGLIPLAGLGVWELVLYDILVIGVTMFHHANISLGRLDPWLRWLIVTPNMHKVHHSRWQPETDSNYSTLFSFWDRLAGTFRMRPDPATIDFGLDEFDETRWQTFGGMLKTPFVDPHATPPDDSERQPAEEVFRSSEPATATHTDER